MGSNQRADRPSHGAAAGGGGTTVLETICPHCRRAGVPAGAEPGAIVDCPDCDGSFVLPGAASDPARAIAVEQLAHPGPAVLSGISRRVAGQRASPSDARLASTGLVAVLVTALFYLALVRPLQESYFGQLFAERGWVPYVISFLSFWSAALLVDKYRCLSRQTRALALDLLPGSIGLRITPANAPAFTSYLRSLPRELAENFLVERVSRALDHFCARADVRETMDQLRSQAERDESVVESSYTMLRVFIWAIPILGFIGTVIGIGASVGGFSESVASAADLEVMKDSIGTVTSGLGVAFDTTLLALVMSIFIMFPTSSLQKAEDDFLARVDDYCRQHLIARLDDTDRAGEAGDERVVQALERVAELLERRLPGAD